MTRQVPSSLDPFRTPIYEIAETARLTGLSAGRVRRWLRGYEYVGGRGHQAPVVRRHHEGHSRDASFLDLIELLYVKRFLERGFSLQFLRKALDEAQHLIGADHPFARSHFYSDGREIYLELESRSPRESRRLLQLLASGQWVIALVILEYAKQIQFDAEGVALCWWPLGKEQPVVLDPTISFGAPVVVSRHVKTSNVYSLYVAERRREKKVADWMQLPIEDVKAAIRFEQQRIRAA